MVGKNDGSINAGLKEIIQIIQAVAQGSSVYYIMRESWLVLQLGTNSNFCRRCNATGRIICNKCKGTGTLRRRPAVFSTLSDQMVSRPSDTYKCPYSGPRGTFDIPPTADQLEDASSYRVHLAEEVEDVLKQAALSRVPSRPFKALAGTQTCPDCNGKVRVTTGLLNLANVFSGVQREASFLFKKCPERYEENELPLSIRKKASTQGGPMHITEYPPLPLHGAAGGAGAALGGASSSSTIADRARRLKSLIEREKNRPSSSKGGGRYVNQLEKELKELNNFL
mmetsp:Transcript_2769/g.7280  ORF Transcript_2769/g.7280 Transcript_2769/m.7280 type:complete len:282 (-) Transcript_2769:45-890(-)